MTSWIFTNCQYVLLHNIIFNDCITFHCMSFLMEPFLYYWMFRLFLIFFFPLRKKKAGMSFLGHKPVKVSISSEHVRSLILTWTFEEIPTSSPHKFVCTFPQTHTDTHTLEPYTVPRPCPTQSLAQSSFSSGSVYGHKTVVVAVESG